MHMVGTVEIKKKLKTHSFLVKCIRIFSVPLLNHLPPKILQALMRTTSHDAHVVIKNPGSTIALEVMYTRHSRNIFKRGLLQGLADLFWHHCVSQPKALRNRLLIVENTFEEELIRIFKTGSRSISIYTLGGGSARALIQTTSKLATQYPCEYITVSCIDKDQKALEFGSALANEYDLTHTFRWIHGNAKHLDTYAPSASVDIIEMVGLLDYFSDDSATELLKKIYAVLKPGGLFIFANVHPNNEMPFVLHLGWPPMYYRREQDLRDLIKNAGFHKSSDIVFEPLRIHMIATARK